MQLAGWVSRCLRTIFIGLPTTAVGTPRIGGEGYLDPPSATIRRARPIQTQCRPGDANINEQAKLHDVQLARGPANTCNRTIGCGAVVDDDYNLSKMSQ